jgi:hypothetical protein
MNFLLSGAVNPRLVLLNCLRRWRLIANHLREPTRRRSLQLDLLLANHFP